MAGRRIIALVMLGAGAPRQTRTFGERAVELQRSRIDDPAQPARQVRVEPTFVHREAS